MPRGRPAALLGGMLLAAAAGAVPIEPGPGAEVFLVQCQQQEFRLDCAYRRRLPAPPGKAATPTAHLGTRDLPIRSPHDYPRPGDTTSVLFLVDTSDPRRAAVVEQNAAQIRAMLKTATPHQRFGVAAFDRELRVLAEPGGDAKTAALATLELRAVGKNTELYRCTLEAVRLLAAQPATRRALFLFSDGLAEDTAYLSEDVVRQARAAEVTIHGLGFARSEQQSPGLQTLRRLSEETGGLFVAAAADLQLPAAFRDAPFSTLDSGGFFQVDFDDSLPTPDPGEFPATAPVLLLRFTTGEQSTPEEFRVPLRLPRRAAPAPPPADQPQAVAAPAPPPTLQPPQQEVAPPQRFTLPPWLLPAVLVVLVLFGFLLLRRTRHRPAEAAPADRTYGYLLPEPGILPEDAPLPISYTPFRIGRADTNDLVLDAPSVSRHHVELFYEKGSLHIRDLDSMNGLLINKERVKECLLRNADLLEIGEYCLHFRTEHPQVTQTDETICMETFVAEESSEPRGQEDPPGQPEQQ